MSAPVFRSDGRGLLVAALAATLLWLAAPWWGRDFTFAPGELPVLEPNALKWSATDAAVRSGRADPHWELGLPWWARAVTELTLVVEPIWGNVGQFQFYYLPNRPVEPYFTAQWRVDVEAAIYGGTHPLHVRFAEPVSRIRVDPPDGAEFFLKSVVVRAAPGQVPVVRAGLWWLMLAGWAAVLLARFWSQGRDWGRRLWSAPAPAWRAALVIFIVLRIGLTAEQPLKAVGGAMHDDQLFIEQAASIAAGQWLGPYNNLTLVKGQGYPLWIAALHRLHVPLVLSHHLLYVLAAVLAYRAWRPMLARPLRFAVVVILLFNPASYHGDDAARILRNHFCASLALLAFVCATGWLLRLQRPVRAQIGWATGLGAALAALWLSREETIWMTGVVGLVALAGAWSLRQAGWPAVRRVVAVAAMPVVIGSLAVTAICALNFRHYGFWGTVEFRQASFKDAYGALLRVDVGPWRQYVPVSREVREAAYAVSPAFTLMQPYLEGELGEGWAALGEWQVGLPPSERQIHGAAFMWALRDGAAAAGQHGSPSQALAYYRSMADEINGACDAGRLPARARRSGFIPPWRLEYAEQLPGFYFESWKFITTFIYCVPKPPPSSGWDSSLAVYRRMTGTVLSPRPEDPPLPPARKRRLDFVHGVLKDVTLLYAWLTPAAIVAAVPLCGWLWWRVRRGRGAWEPVFVATAALAGALAITLICTLVHVTSFVGITIGYQAAAYPLMLAFGSITLAAAAQGTGGGGGEPDA